MPKDKKLHIYAGLALALGAGLFLCPFWDFVATFVGGILGYIILKVL